MAKIRRILLTLVVTGTLWECAAGQAARFFADDPIRAMPPPLPLHKLPLSQDVNDIMDFLVQSSRSALRPPKPAGAVNTLGNVPDSEWFTNRHAQRRMSRYELQRGPNSSEAPVPPFTVIAGKDEGISTGFRMTD